MYGCVLADCRKVTQEGFRHFPKLDKMRSLALRGRPDGVLTEAFLEVLQGFSQLYLLYLGGYQGSQIRGNITAGVVTRSVRLHTRADNYISQGLLQENFTGWPIPVAA